MAKLSRKLAGSTLIEVLIAMVIIMIVFAIAIKVFNNVLSSGTSFQKVKVQQQLATLSERVRAQGFIADTNLSLDSVDYEFITDTSGISGIAKVEIKAKQSGRLLGSLKCLYHVKKETQD